MKGTNDNDRIRLRLMQDYFAEKNVLTELAHRPKIDMDVYEPHRVKFVNIVKALYNLSLSENRKPPCDSTRFLEELDKATTPEEYQTKTFNKTMRPKLWRFAFFSSNDYNATDTKKQKVRLQTPKMNQSKLNRLSKRY